MITRLACGLALKFSLLGGLTMLHLWSPPAKAQEYPAPWSLEGDGYIVLSAVSKDANLQGGFIAEGLKDRFGTSLGMFMLVDYRVSPVGPYRELLYIPGIFEFEDGKQHASISKIFVSSLTSVVHGRKNWGIPKEHADFAVEKTGDGLETIKVFSQENTVARFTFSSWGPKFPITTFMLPSITKTLAQSLEGSTYVFDLRANGWAQLAKLEAAESNPDFFPDLPFKRVLIAVKISDFKMEFRAPQVMESKP